MELAEYQEWDWKRGQRWADACLRGDCAYAGAAPDKYLGDGCPGYHVTLYWEETRPVLRYGECVRKRAWHERRRAAKHSAPLSVVGGPVRRRLPEDGS
jgi:hypothetical protein